MLARSRLAALSVATFLSFAVGAARGESTALSVSVYPLGAVNIEGGHGHTCALTTAGGVKCWGDNYIGQLGNGTLSRRTAPVDVPGLTSGVKSIGVSGDHTCALTTAGGVRCWGDNGNGQLGNGTTVSRNQVDVTGLASGVAALALGDVHTCALTTGGGVKCWGGNSGGDLGDGTSVNRPTPVDVVGLASGVVAIAAGDSHTCAVTTAGRVKCWGRNWSGQLGDGTTVGHMVPADVLVSPSPAGGTPLTGVVAIATHGGSHTCALTTGGGVKCWGDNTYGQLGDGTLVNRLLATDVWGLTSGATAIAAGEEHACARTAAGGVKCWGHNWRGQLGDGTLIDRQAPVDVPGLTSAAAAIGTGYGNSCVLTSTGAANCTGENAAGNIGDGTTTLRTALVGVKGFAGAGGLVSSSPAGIACGATCYTAFTTGTQVTLSQTPSPGYLFLGWSGACSGNGACTVPMATANSVSATYELAATPTGGNFQGLWWNAPAGSEAGWGINFAHQGDIIFATWFTYDAEGEPWWLIAELHKTGPGVYTGDISTVAGPAFNTVPWDLSKVKETPVGTMTASFSSIAMGSLAYTVNGIAQTKTITKQAFGPVPTCVWGAQTDLGLSANYQDLWWNAGESGWGVNFTHQGDIIFATWFTYDAAGKPWWLIAELHKGAGATYTGPVSSVSGQAFDTVPWNVNKIVETAIGTATVTFANGNSSTLAYTVNGASQSKSITRQVFAPPGTVCQ